MKKVTRRDFIRRSAAGAAGAGMAFSALPASAQVAGANDRVRIGIIGAGKMGRSNMGMFLEQPNVEVVALCDVYQSSLDQCLKSKALTEAGKQPETDKDFRRMLDRKDVDAVVISSPDHWHALQTVMACQSGKDVYVEKPISVAVEEGRKMVQAARKYNRIVQVGTWQRSGVHFQRAVKLIRDGVIGKISFVKTWNYSNEYPKGWGNPPDADPLEGLDWELWLGPAPKVPFNINRFGILGNRWATFRYFWDYAGGMMTDWGVHLLDIVQWAMQVAGPTVVTASGGKFFIQDNRDTPDTLQVTYEYPGWICTYENRVCNANSMYGKNYGIEFHGTDGTMYLNRSGFEVHPEKRRVGREKVDMMESSQMKRVNNGHEAHVPDFLDAMRSRRLPQSDIEIGDRSTNVCHLANIALRSGRRIVWDPKRQVLVEGGGEAKKLLSREYRKPWKLEV